MQSFTMSTAPESPASPALVDTPVAPTPPVKTEIVNEVPGNRPGRRVYISPYARRMAEGLGVDWQKVTGSGLGGRIMARDIQTAIAKINVSPASSVMQPGIANPPVATKTISTIPQASAPTVGRAPMSTMRRSIAEHMSMGAHTAAPVTLTCEVDATQLVNLRRQLKEEIQSDNRPVPSYNDMLAKIVAQALLEHPQINACIDGNDIVFFSSVHVAIAVDTDRGLLAPVLRDVQTKSLRQIAQESVSLIEKTRLGTAPYEELQGGTFTITNLGAFEIEAFTPIINMPQCAILGVGQIIPKQIVIDAELEKMAIQQRMVLSLTFDHRLVDGTQAARFLQRIKRLIEKPFLWLAG
jgi:pyruvate dehydrogenase E2 component (dihydrolipoamide acetyltransferase)